MRELQRCSYEETTTIKTEHEKKTSSCHLPLKQQPCPALFLQHSLLVKSKAERVKYWHEHRLHRERLQKLQLALIYVYTQQANQVDIDRRRKRVCCGWMNRRNWWMTSDMEKSSSWRVAIAPAPLNQSLLKQIWDLNAKALYVGIRSDFSFFSFCLRNIWRRVLLKQAKSIHNSLLMVCLVRGNRNIYSFSIPYGITFHHLVRSELCRMGIDEE